MYLAQRDNFCSFFANLKPQNISSRLEVKLNLFFQPIIASLIQRQNEH